MRDHECQICERAFTAKKGLLSKHGYKRPGDGFLHGECFGAHRAAFPATDALVEYRAIIAGMLGDAFAVDRRLAAEAPTFSRTVSVFAPELAQRMRDAGHYLAKRGPYAVVDQLFVPGVSALSEYGYDEMDYGRNLERVRYEAAAQVRRLVGELARVDARIAAGAAKAAA